MKLLLAFLLTTFVIGGAGWRPRTRRGTALLASACVVVGIMFYSRRVL